MILYLTDEMKEAIQQEVRILGNTQRDESGTLYLTDEMKGAIQQEVEHRCDVFTDGEWFTDKIKFGLCDLLLGEEVESCEGLCSEDLVALLRKVLGLD